LQSSRQAITAGLVGCIGDDKEAFFDPELAERRSGALLDSEERSKLTRNDLSGFQKPNGQNLANIG
jgi:hypothetical protein